MILPVAPPYINFPVQKKLKQLRTSLSWPREIYRRLSLVSSGNQDHHSDDIDVRAATETLSGTINTVQSRTLLSPSKLPGCLTKVDLLIQNLSDIKPALSIICESSQSLTELTVGFPYSGGQTRDAVPFRSGPDPLSQIESTQLYRHLVMEVSTKFTGCRLNRIKLIKIVNFMSSFDTIWCFIKSKVALHKLESLHLIETDNINILENDCPHLISLKTLQIWSSVEIPGIDDVLQALPTGLEAFWHRAGMASQTQWGQWYPTVSSMLRHKKTLKSLWWELVRAKDLYTEPLLMTGESKYNRGFDVFAVNHLMEFSSLEELVCSVNLRTLTMVDVSFSLSERL